MTTQFRATKGPKLMRALLAIGWRLNRINGSHHFLVRPGWAPFVFIFWKGEIGPPMLAKIAKKTGLTPADLA